MGARLFFPFPISCGFGSDRIESNRIGWDRIGPLLFLRLLAGLQFFFNRLRLFFYWWSFRCGAFVPVSFGSVPFYFISIRIELDPGSDAGSDRIGSIGSDRLFFFAI